MKENRLIRSVFSFFLFFAFVTTCSSQKAQTKKYWQITERNSILLDLTKKIPLPHKDNIEMSGSKVSAIISYEIDKDNNLYIDKDLIFPQLRTFNKTNEPDWKKYRAYFRRVVSSEFAPIITFNQKTIVPSEIDSIEIGGKISFFYSPIMGLKLTKTILPSMDQRFLLEEWSIENLENEIKDIQISNIHYSQSERGYKGNYTFIVESQAKRRLSLKGNKSYAFPVLFGATLNQESALDFNYKKAKQTRQSFLDTIQNQLVFKSPNKLLNTLFYFAKIRASESIFNSSMGLVHSPGGGNYYVGIWANDQIEYSGPFFPYLGYDIGNTAAYNAYKKFLENIPENNSHIPYAFEVDGNFPMGHLDRGDAAMLAYGTSQYLLARGSLEEVKTLWPLVEWSLDYCHKMKNQAGAIKSESDEMEGRIETGDANLSTSSLYYGGLKQSIHLAQVLDKEDKVRLYKERMEEMERVIENYFGANIDGLDTYKYYKENKLLRHWICLPLVMGLTQRKDATLQALFEKLWTENGILVEYNPAVDLKDAIFWDRATLYALRGAMKVGEVELAYQKLLAYSQKRLLGDHVPYPIEAYPENNMKHLSAESALYCRILLEGLLGIEPIGLSKVEIEPKLPQDWDQLAVDNIYLCGKAYDLRLKRVKKGLELSLLSQGKIVFQKNTKTEEKLSIDL